MKHIGRVIEIKFFGSDEYPQICIDTRGYSSSGHLEGYVITNFELMKVIRRNITQGMW